MWIGELKTKLENFVDIRRFMVEMMRSHGAAKRDITETLLIFEALYNDMLEAGIGADTEVLVTGNKSFGDITISVGFEGEMYIPMTGRSENAEERVMGAFADKIEYMYHGGFNNLSITVTRHISKTLILSGIALGIALLVYSELVNAMSAESQNTLFEQLVFPLERLFANAVMMVGAPVTFFSLVRNLTDAYIVAAKGSGVRRLQLGTITTSVISVVMALVVGLLVGNLVADSGVIWESNVAKANSTPEGIIESLVPSSIFAPFETMSPIPLIIVALLVTYGFCHAGRYFEGMKKVTDACYTLFSKMLSVVMYAIPFFFFMAIMDVLFDGGPIWVAGIVLLALIVIASLVFVALFYVIRMKSRGVAVMPFVRKLWPLVRENFAINSAIDAVPFNSRYCMTVFGMDRKKLEEYLPLLAQLNLDGNCFVIMMITMVFITVMGIPVTWFDILVIMILVVFLSMGAPNQPGSIVIGMLIIINYLRAYDMVAVAIYTEIFFGSIVNIVNVVGDIVTLAIEDDNMKKLMS